MCGIFGIINYSNSLNLKDDLKSLAKQMHHRGPDDESYFIDGHVGIGMKRLSIIDLTTGNQPFFSSDSKVILVLNGEIYNYKKLKIDLIKKGYKFRSDSDVEVLVFLYEEYGLDCIKYINGMFSFALVDLSKKLIWLVRDRLGIKPLYYYHDNERFIFSSELSGISNLVKSKINDSAILDYLAFSYIPAPKSIYENIFKVLPAEQIVVGTKNKNISQSFYWQLKDFENLELTQKQADNNLDKLISKTVDEQMMSDVPIGIFLSGGLDSSIITSYASTKSKNPINTFTIDFKNKLSKDSFFANLVSKNINSCHYSIKVDSKMQLNTIDEIVGFMDEPMSDSAIVPTYIISKFAKEKGIKVLLSGAGGDEIFGGYNRYFSNKIGSAAWFASKSQIF